MATLTRSIIINAPVETVFDRALDLRQFWTWKDVTLTDVDLKPGGVGTSARMHAHLMGFPIAGEVEYTEVVREQRIVAQVRFFAEKPTWTFTFKPVEGGTEMTAQGEWIVKLPVVGKSVEGRMVKEHEPYLEAMLADFKARVEARSAA